MYYKKLEVIFVESKCSNEFTYDLLLSFDRYLQSAIIQDKTYVNPYEFSVINKVTLEESIKFFLYFVDDTNSHAGVISTSPFFECTSSTCDERIFLEECKVDDHEYLCPECNKLYLYGDIKSVIKVYFTINRSVIETDSGDINSTIDILERLPDSLKGESPSSMNNLSNLDENDEGEVEVDLEVDLELIQSVNNPDENTVISTNFDEMYTRFAHNYTNFLKG